ncbi:Odorant receptor 7 [Ephemera danica]|nr:Odorant receptor 7 [Ephemera danica]
MVFLWLDNPTRLQNTCSKICHILVAFSFILTVVFVCIVSVTIVFSFIRSLTLTLKMFHTAKILNFVFFKQKCVIDSLKNSLSSISAPIFLSKHVYDFIDSIENVNKKWKMFYKSFSISLNFAAAIFYLFRVYMADFEFFHVLLLFFLGIAANFILFMHLGLHILQITWIRIICHVLDHINNVILTLHHEERKLNNETTNLVYQNRVARTLDHIGQIHQTALKLVNGFNTYFDTLLFVNIMTDIASVVLTPMQQIMRDEKQSLIRDYSVPVSLSLSFALLLIKSWFGSLIIRTGSTVALHSMSNARWQSWNIENKVEADKVVAMFQSELRLTAGPFYYLSMKTFSSVVGAAFSYTFLIKPLYSMMTPNN